MGILLLRLAPRLVQRADRAAQLGDEAIAAGAKGILFRSTQAAGGTNLVLFVDQLGEGDRLDVNDPAGALPRNQVSWGEPTA